MAVKKLRLRESENGSLKDLMRAVRSRINELDSNYTTEDYDSGNDLEEFDGYKFDPNSSWTTIYQDVIEPIINEHFDIIGVNGYTQQEAENDIDAIVNIFDDEFGTEYPNVHKACMKFWTGY